MFQEVVKYFSQYQELPEELVYLEISPFSNTPTSVFLCVQVIMIECADLKNVINYQEVEALKHTIKVYRERDEWMEGGREEGHGLKDVIRHQKTQKPLLFSSGFIHHQVEGS